MHLLLCHLIVTCPKKNSPTATDQCHQQLGCNILSFFWKKFSRFIILGMLASWTTGNDLNGTRKRKNTDIINICFFTQLHPISVVNVMIVVCKYLYYSKVSTTSQGVPLISNDFDELYIFQFSTKLCIIYWFTLHFK